MFCSVLNRLLSEENQLTDLDMIKPIKQCSMNGGHFKAGEVVSKAAMHSASEGEVLRCIPACDVKNLEDAVLMRLAASMRRAEPRKPEWRDSLRHKTSNSPAAPMPPPMHIVTTTCLAPRFLPSISAWPTMRAPDMP